MKKMNLMSFLLIAIIISACSSNSIKTVTGKVTNATPSSLTIITDDGKSYKFETLGSERVGLSETNIGDTFNIYYSGSLDDSKTEQNVKVKKREKIKAD